MEFLEGWGVQFKKPSVEGYGYFLEQHIPGLHIPVSGDQKICIWWLFFTNYYLLTPFLINWPLEQVFRGHFGPQVNFLAETLS